MARLKTMARLKIGFMGTAEFAVPTLRALNDAGHDIVCVYTQPPRPAGRGHKPRDTPVHDAATGLGLALRTPASFRGDDERRDFAGLGLDACVVVAYGLILPRPVLDAPRLGCLNLHPSLLPRWRGPAPIPRCIEAGDSETGVCAMVMDEGVDTGPVLMVERVPVAAHASAGDLHDDLAARGARLMVAALDGLAAGRLTATPQAADGATHAAKLDKAEGRLDWRRPAAELDRRVRAFSPWPGAHAEVGGKPLKILAAECVAGAGAPGALLHGGFHVACGDGVLRLIRVQAPGRAATDGDAFLRGARLGPGTILA